MSSRHTVSGTYFKPGGWNVWCQRCGRKIKNDQIKKEWDGLFVCAPCFEERHPQDMVRGVLDQQSVPYAVPEIADRYTLPAAVTGLTTAALAVGPEDVFDDTASLQVQLVSGALPTATELEVLNGANLAAVQGSSGDWEVIQYTVASLTAPNTYSLTHLLRGRYGTERAMGAGVGSPFVFLGDAGAVNNLFMQTYLQVGKKLFSPVHLSAYEDSGDIVFTWTRRSRTPSLELDDWADAYFSGPLDSIDERYEVDVMDGATVKRTLRTIGSPRVSYPRAQHVADWGSLQASLTARVYQTDQIVGRGTYREATFALSYDTAFDTLYDDQGHILRDQLGNILI
jgi:hypothetical protein